jgi:hypothetical protein
MDARDNSTRKFSQEAVQVSYCFGQIGPSILIFIDCVAWLVLHGGVVGIQLHP